MIVAELQRSRNKLVHFHTPLRKGDRFDLKYDVTHVLIQVIATITKTEDANFVHGCQSFLGQVLFNRLIGYEPYQERIQARARDLDPRPLTCAVCGVASFLRDEETCLCCGYSGEVQLLRCPQCSERAVFYDHLNLSLNDSLAAKCGRCDWTGRARHCATHVSDHLIVDSHGGGCWLCAFDDETAER